jgi:hypothetical protein
MMMVVMMMVVVLFHLLVISIVVAIALPHVIAILTTCDLSQLLLGQIAQNNFLGG